MALSQIYEVGKTDYYRGLEAKVRTYFSLKQTNFVKEIAHSSIHQLKTPTKGNDYFYVMNFFFFTVTEISPKKCFLKIIETLLSRSG